MGGGSRSSFSWCPVCRLPPQHLCWQVLKVVGELDLSEFLRRYREGLRALFVQVLALCARHGLVDLSTVAMDGSPMHAAAARSANRSLDVLETVIADGEAQLAHSTHRPVRAVRWPVAGSANARRAAPTGVRGWPRASRANQTADGDASSATGDGRPTATRP
ncbi:hypothetical protein ABZ570_26045 [Micromonospora sp. NPDC007271]|uniref:hypothetical protein n=1 Tax=Micromonospora sp. NPDC007271 TaxID=3154587 RepID=UPI0033FB6FAE